MQYQVFPPPAGLKSYVRFFWAFEGNTNGNPYVYRSMASGCPELIFHYRGTFAELTPGGDLKQSFSLVHAQSGQFRRFITLQHFGIFGAYLYPYAIPYLFGPPSCELSHQMPDLAALLGRAGQELEEKVMLATSHAQRAAIVSHFFAQRLASNPPGEDSIQAAIRQVIQAENVPSVGQLATAYNLSTRQLERKFKKYAGLSPKLFTRITRFQAALNHYQKGADGSRCKSLTEIGYACGYYDQAHFIHDFKNFSGYHPKQYFSGKAEGIEYREA